MMKNVILYSDGSSRGNPGPGGYGTILRYNDSKNENEFHELELTEGFAETTNNRMELMGVIAGLEALTSPCEVKVITDSQYVVKAFNEHWIEGWLKTNWKNGTVKNIDLWERLLKAKEPHSVTFEWVKGHAGHPENERCDRLATMSADGITTQPVKQKENSAKEMALEVKIYTEDSITKCCISKESSSSTEYSITDSFTVGNAVDDYLGV